MYLTAVAVLAFASASFAQVNVDLTGTGNSTIVWGPNFGVYVDPYTATVGSQTGVPVICDDWSDNTNVGESWTANVTSVSTLSNTTPTNPPLFQSLALGNNPTPSPQGLNQAQLYDELVYLSVNLMGAVGSNNTNEQIVASFAMWELTYGAVGSNGTPSNPDGNPATFLAGATNYSGSALQASVNSLLTSAQNALNAPGGINTQGWEILTPTPESTTEPQEFLVYTPESSAVIMFSADMLGLLALAFVFRKRLVVPVL
jgi:hypothetical protein